jgi:hypothetical protein
MHIRLFVYLIFTLSTALLFSQNAPSTISAHLYWNHANNSLSVKSNLTFHRNTFTQSGRLYLYDWNHSFSSKNSPLGISFQQRFDRSFHLAKEEERGFTKDLIIALDSEIIDYRRVNYDVIELILPQPVESDSVTLNLSYTLKLPSNKFTGYGNDQGEALWLKNSFILPIPLEEAKNEIYHHYNRGNQHTGLVHYSISFDRGDNHFIHSDLTSNSYFNFSGITATPPLFVIDHNDSSLLHYTTPKWSVHLDSKMAKNLADPIQTLDRIVAFTNQVSPMLDTSNLVLTYGEYTESPIQLVTNFPSILSPYPDEFVQELKLLKTLMRKQLLLGFDSNMQREHFYLDGFVQYQLENYVAFRYDNLKLIGKFGSIWPFNRYRLGEITVNEHFKWLSRFIDNQNLDQPLLTPTAQLLNYNYSIANPIKASQLFRMSFNPSNASDNLKALQDFQKSSYLSSGVSGFDLKWFLPPGANAPVVSDRLFTSRERTDFRIKDFKRSDDVDSLLVSYSGIYPMPVRISQFVHSKEVAHQWVTNSSHETWVNFDSNSKARYIVNPYLETPEFNSSNNSYNPRSRWFKSPIKILPFTDLDDLRYAQLYLTPQTLFNIYDGVSFGAQVTNESLVTKPIEYQFSPFYSSKEKSLIGAFNIASNHWLNDENRSRLTAGIFGLTQHFDINSRYTTVTPYLRLNQNVEGITSRTNQSFFARVRAVSRSLDREAQGTVTLENPDYIVLNFRYQKVKQSLFNFKSVLADLQFSESFIKVASSAEYRRLFDNNTQISLRFFGGLFIKNANPNDFFSFSIGRPNDYLYDYSLIGRSESEGFSAQQLIRAEGGFVSEVDQGLSNRAIVSTNAAVNLWRFIEIYTELGLIKNQAQDAQYLYGSGFRLNLVPDYLEIYFPVHNRNGFESFDTDYSTKIRFVLTLQFETLSRLFTRSLF